MLLARACANTVTGSPPAHAANSATSPRFLTCHQRAFDAQRDAFRVKRSAQLLDPAVQLLKHPILVGEDKLGVRGFHINLAVKRLPAVTYVIPK